MPTLAAVLTASLLVVACSAGPGSVDEAAGGRQESSDQPAAVRQHDGGIDDPPDPSSADDVGADDVDRPDGLIGEPVSGGGDPEGPALGPDAVARATACGSGGEVSVVGPASVEAIARRAAELFLATCPDVEFTIDRSDEELGFALLCAGLVDVAGATREPTDGERERCAEAGLELAALPLAHEALVVVTGRGNEDPSCLGFAELYALMGPESVGFDRWSDAADLAREVGVDEFAAADRGLEIFGPADGDADRLGFEEIVLAPTADDQGTEPQVRSDLTGMRDVSEMVESVGSSEQGLGWLSYDLAVANAEAVTTVPLRRDVDGDCVAPSAESVADGSYPASRRLTLWVPVGPDDAARSFVEYLYSEIYPVAVGSANGSTGYLTLPGADRDAALDVWRGP